MAILPGYPKWSPDQTLIAFHGDPDGRPDVLVVPARGGQPRNITKGRRAAPIRASLAMASGSTLRQASTRVNSFNCRRCQQRAAQPVQVTEQCRCRSPSNRTAVTSSTSTTPTGRARCGACRRAGGPAVKVVDGVVLGNFDVVEDGLYYIDRVSGDAGSFSDRPDGETRLRYYDFATSRSTTVATNLGTVRARPERDPRRPDCILLACRLVDRRVESS